ncbi:hypothetical protein BOX37_29675 [Nocardia mangyaensis]|uniref:ESX secretion-associated protein EspG n=1 Tax=Nocardia mangyaensis TaxID=2213200 RepID=A0A1J0VZK1_9NOCA|nr:hypothetical protein [Nocardia mangyaensis]APE37409.1 hypothetical protein BOX37_29675 [Nocardia mangyaensis]
MSWVFTADEFACVWRTETGADCYPFPITAHSAVRDEHDYEALARAAAQRWPTGADPDLTAVLRHAAQPETAMALFSNAGPPLRAYGARSGVRGVVLRQYDDHSVEVFSGGAAMVGRAFAAFLGEQPAGRAGHLIEDVDRLTAHFESWQQSGESIAARMHTVAAAERTAAGHIEARVGTDTDHPTPARYLTWFDVDGDGRYLTYRWYRDLHIEPVGKDRLIEAISTLGARPASDD